MYAGHGCDCGVEANLSRPATAHLRRPGGGDGCDDGPPGLARAAGADGGEGLTGTPPPPPAGSPHHRSWALKRKGRGARAGIMQLRPWDPSPAAAAAAAVNMEPVNAAAAAATDRQAASSAAVGCLTGWAPSDDVAGVFDILLDLDVFLNDQVRTGSLAPPHPYPPDSDIGGLAWLDVWKEEAEEEEVEGKTQRGQEKEVRGKGRKAVDEEAVREEHYKEEKEEKAKEEKEKEQKKEEKGQEKKEGGENWKEEEKEEQENEEKEKEEKATELKEKSQEGKGNEGEKAKQTKNSREERGEMRLASGSSSPSDTRSLDSCSSPMDAGDGTSQFVTGACLECLHAEVGTALRGAVLNGHAACLQCILNNLAPDAGPDRGGGASSAGLSERLARDFPLLDAVDRGHEDVLRLGLGFLRGSGRLAEALAAADGQGRRPVHLAAHRDHRGCLELLLACTPAGEAGLWLDGRAGRTPLQHAAAAGSVRCLRRLLEVEGASVTTSSGRTTVSLAAQAGSVSCLEELIDGAEADARQADEDGMTPVHYAAQAGHLNCTHWLVRRAQCSLNESRKKDGATAMHLAAGKGRCPILQWALNRELSSAGELDVFGRTPVHYAAEEGQITALRTLAKFPRVNLDAKDFLGRTPSNLAERRGHSACVRFLDSCLQQRHPDGEGALLAKLTRSISSPGGLNNKLNRRNSNRRSGRRKHISSVYLEEKTPMPGLERSATLREPAHASTEEGAGHILSSLISQVGLMAAAPAVPEPTLHRRIINSLFRKVKAQTEVEDFTVTL